MRDSSQIQFAGTPQRMQEQGFLTWGETPQTAGLIGTKAADFGVSQSRLLMSEAEFKEHHLAKRQNFVALV